MAEMILLLMIITLRHPIPESLETLSWILPGLPETLPLPLLRRRSFCPITTSTPTPSPGMVKREVSLPCGPILESSWSSRQEHWPKESQRAPLLLSLSAPWAVFSDQLSRREAGNCPPPVPHLPRAAQSQDTLHRAALYDQLTVHRRQPSGSHSTQLIDFT